MLVFAYSRVYHNKLFYDIVEFYLQYRLTTRAFRNDVKAGQKRVTDEETGDWMQNPTDGRILEVLNTGLGAVRRRSGETSIVIGPALTDGSPCWLSTVVARVDEDTTLSLLSKQYLDAELGMQTSGVGQ